MSDFAAGERYLNRVWSASADGYADEAMDYIDRARQQFEEARAKLAQAHAGAAALEAVGLFNRGEVEFEEFMDVDGNGRIDLRDMQELVKIIEGK